MRILLDFDGTCVKFRYPEVGNPVPNVISTLIKLVNAGHELVLFTARQNDNSRNELTQVIEWFKQNEIPITIYDDNKYIKSGIGMIIDDMCLGIPKTYDVNYVNEHYMWYVDWYEIERMLKKMSLI